MISNKVAPANRRFGFSFRTSVASFMVSLSARPPASSAPVAELFRSPNE